MESLSKTMRDVNAEIYGIQVIPSPALDRERPVIQLSPTFKWCSDEFRDKQNKMLADKFGYTMNVFMMNHPVSGRECMITHPDNVKMIVASMDARRGSLLIFTFAQKQSWGN